MAKRPDSPAGARFRDWLESKFGSISKGAAVFEVSPESLNPYFKGTSRLGGIWIDRIRENGGDYEYILTGHKQSNEILDTKQQYVKEEVYTMAIPHNFGDDIEIEKTELGEKTQFTFYRLKKKDDYRETMRNAEPEFTEGQKMPMPLRIEDKPEGVLIKPFEIQGKAAAKPVQPDSRKEYEESL